MRGGGTRFNEHPDLLALHLSDPTFRTHSCVIFDKRSTRILHQDAYCSMHAPDPLSTRSESPCSRGRPQGPFALDVRTISTSCAVFHTNAPARCYLPSQRSSHPVFHCVAGARVRPGAADAHMRCARSANSRRKGPNFSTSSFNVDAPVPDQCCCGGHTSISSSRATGSALSTYSPPITLMEAETKMATKTPTPPVNEPNKALAKTP